MGGPLERVHRKYGNGSARVATAVPVQRIGALMRVCAAGLFAVDGRSSRILREEYKGRLLGLYRRVLERKAA